jgi:adenosine kinase
MGRIAVTGSVAYDTIMVFPGRFADHILPDKTHLLNVSFQVDTLERRRGGTAANVCYSMALLGEHPVLCAAVGAADFAEYDAELTAAGVDTSAALRCEDVGTAAAFITTDLDDNQITAFFSGAMARAAGVDLTRLEDVTDVVVGADAPDAMRVHIEQAAGLHARLIFAPAQQIPSLDDTTLRSGLETAWLVVGNDYEMEMIRGRTGVDIDGLRSHRIVAVTRGAAGSELHTKDGVIAIPAAPVRAVVDPTGAGDAYLAGLISGLRAGEALDIAGRMGAVVASFAVESRGPQGHVFTLGEFRTRYDAAMGAHPSQRHLTGS